MPIQVLVVKGDRRWDSIRNTDRRALARVATHLTNDSDEEVVMVGRAVTSLLLFGAEINNACKPLDKAGFSVTFKLL